MTASEAYEVNLAWTDLVIAGRLSQIDQLLGEIERFLPKEWVRNTAAEQQSLEIMKRKGWSITPGRCYSRKLANCDVRLWLERPSEYRVHGGLVEPTNPVRYLEDNAETIRDFRQFILEPAVKTCNLKIGRYSAGPLSWVSADVMKRLWAFYDTTRFHWPPEGDALPRWREFVIRAYQNHAAFDLKELERWLVEKGWEKAKADGLIAQLLADAALLSEYEELRQPA